MPADLDDWIPTEKWQLNWVVDPPVSADRIPKAAELDLYLIRVRELPFEGLVRFKCPLLMFSLARLSRIHLQDVGHRSLIPGQSNP